MDQGDIGVTHRGLKHFLTFPEEKLLVVKRKHWFTLLPSLAFTSFFSFIAIIAAYIVFLLFFSAFMTFISVITTVFVLYISLIAKTIIDWHYHLYVVTTRKIIEVIHSPLFFYSVNGILLYQVRCTEIDVQVNGILKEYLDMGDVSITFDRPTHQEEFVLTDIQDPKATGIILSNALDWNPSDTSTTIWSQGRSSKQAGGKSFRIIDTTYPRQRIGAV